MRVLTSSGQWRDVALASGLLDGSWTHESSPLVELVPGPDGIRRATRYETVYESNPWLWATVQLLANGAARMPLHVFRWTGNGGERERVRPGVGSAAERLARALRRPGERVSAQALWRSTMVDRKVHGNALWVPRMVGRELDGFRRVPWSQVGRSKIAGERVYWDIAKPDERWFETEVVHFGYASDADDWCAPSPIGALQATLALHDAVARHLIGFFRNAAHPSAHVEVDRATSKKAREMIRDAIRELYTSPENAGKVLVTSGKWSPMSSTPDHSRVVELAKQSREEIVAAYNMPPPLVGILDRAIMANVRELRSHYARDVVGPDMVLFEGDLDAQVIAPDPALDDVFVEFQLAAVIRPDPEAQAAAFKDRRLVESVNEIRQTLNLPRVDHPDADVPWMPLNEAPIGGESADEAPMFRRPEEDDDE